MDWRRPKRERYFDGSFGIDVTFLKSYLSRVPVEVQSVPLTRLGPWLHSEHGRDGPLVGRIDPTRLPSADP
ncbi:MAG TPA: hypothetical protein VGV64_03260, partial [Thermoplasmata archaeon]|nr:hypothetical protein [Thermoplasmata archaeon]